MLQETAENFAAAGEVLVMAAREYVETDRISADSIRAEMDKRIAIEGREQQQPGTQPRHDTCLPGRQSNELFSTLHADIPPWADLDQTSISVYCDFDRPPARGVTGAPIN